jgi:hypothetical protein
MSTPAQPVFGAEDRVRSDQTNLPQELRGVTDPVKIANYYQQREARMRDEFRAQQDRAQRTSSQFEQRTDSTPRITEVPNSQQPAQLTVAETQAARNTLVQTARAAAMAGKKYWTRLEGDINTIMGQQPPENQVDVNVWSTAYNSLVGAHLDRLLREDAETASAAEAARITSERSAAPPGQEPTPAPLPVEVTGKILPGLNISEQQYRAAQDHIQKGVWPLTSDNTNGRRILIGGGESERR